MVISVAAFLDDSSERRELDELFKVRDVALDMVYDVPGYAYASRDLKNWLYDIVRDRVLLAADI